MVTDCREIGRFLTWLCIAASGLSLASAAAAQPISPVHSERTGGERWGVDYFPNVLLRTHAGKTVRFFDDLIAGKVVVINFMYTTCPDVCPLETAKLAELQAILGDRVGRDVFMYSITIDPATDTSEILAEYAKRFQVGPGWTFLTGKESDILLLRKKLGLFIEEIQDASKDHNVSLIIGNQATGRWMKRSPFENPYFLANQVGSWLHNWKEAAPNQDSYENAPEVRKLGRGEQLFRTRCSSCHVIGASVQLAPHLRKMRQVGPDLLDVTERRDRLWLSRWLAEPDKMLAEEDPLALEMYAKHDRLAMPNMSLDSQDVATLLDYLETESRRVGREIRNREIVPAAATGQRPVGECCQKSKVAVVGEAAKKAPGASDATPPSELAAPPPASEGVPGDSRGAPEALVGLYAAGVGCLFLVLAALVYRRFGG